MSGSGGGDRLDTLESWSPLVTKLRLLTDLLMLSLLLLLLVRLSTLCPAAVMVSWWWRRRDLSSISSTLWALVQLTPVCN